MEDPNNDIEYEQRRFNFMGDMVNLKIYKFDNDFQSGFLSHSLRIEDALDKLNYAKRLVVYTYPEISHAQLSKIPYEGVVDLYREAVDVNKNLRFEKAYSKIRKCFYERNPNMKTGPANPEERKETQNEEEKYEKENASLDLRQKVSNVDFSELEKKISAEVFSQQEAIRHILSPLITLKHKGWPKDGLNAAYLAGPSGVGKTSSIREMKDILEVPFLYLQGSEYMEPHSKENLIGAPQSYVGYQEGGILTNFLKENPEGFILFDEIDKVHMEVFTSLHSFLGDGFVTDSNGKKFPFQGFVYFTSNTGNRLSQSGMGRSIGFNSANKSHKEIEKDRIKNILEEQGVQKSLLGRINSFIRFDSLDNQTLENILTKNIEENNEVLQYFDFSLTDDAREKIVSLGKPEDFGARNIAKNLGRCVIDVLCYEFEINKLFEEGSQIEVDFSEDKFLYFDSQKKLFECDLESFGF